MAKDKEKKLKNKNKKLKKKLENALRHIATLEGKDPEQLVSSFKQEESDSNTDKLLDALGLEKSKKKVVKTTLSRTKGIINQNETNEICVPASKLILEAAACYDNENAFDDIEKYKGSTIDEKIKARKNYIHSIVEKYCVEKNIPESSKKRLEEYIIKNNGNESSSIIRFLRESIGDIEPENFDPPDVLNTDRALSASESTMITMSYFEKCSKRAKLENLIKRLIA